MLKIKKFLPSTSLVINKQKCAVMILLNKENLLYLTIILQLRIQVEFVAVFPMVNI